MIEFHVDQAGFRNLLVCGTINYFDGWVIGRDTTNPVTDVVFIVNGNRLGAIPVRKERPDLAKLTTNTRAGFAGVIDIPATAAGESLKLFACLRDQSLYPMGQYVLVNRLSADQLAFRKRSGLPSDMLMHLVVHNVDPEAFLAEGEAAVHLITALAQRHAPDWDHVGSVLDFGVGCGRVMRWWEPAAQRTRFYGTDVNPALIAWCAEHLPFAQFSVNSLHPPTEFKDSQFGLIYAFSVFTHLTLETQQCWLSEFFRILRPGGILLVSVHGDYHARMLSAEEYEAFRSARHYVLTADAEGENMCATYQSQEVSQELFSEQFEIREYLPQALQSCGGQDLFVLQSPSGDRKDGPIKSPQRWVRLDSFANLSSSRLTASAASPEDAGYNSPYVTAPLQAESMKDRLPLEHEYARRCCTSSDINEHLPTLRVYAARVQRVTEMGIDTSANSTVAMMASCPGRMISYDIQDLDVSALVQLASGAGIDWRFHRANVLDVEIEPTDLLLIDTWHHYVQLKAEFELHADRVSTYIAMHDTEVYRDVGSCNASGGLWQAVEEAVASGQWAICHLAVNNNGLTILQRTGPPVRREINRAVIDEARRLALREFAEYLT